MWFHLKDRQRSVAATALGLRKSLAQKPTSFACQRASQMTERHSRAILDCRDTFKSLSTAVKALVPRGSEKLLETEAPKRVILEVALRKRYGVFLNKTDKSVPMKASIVRPEPRTPINLKDIATRESEDPLSCKVLPPKTESNKHTEQEKCPAVSDKSTVTDLNANTVPKRSFSSCATPTKGKRFSKQLPLRRIVIMREHQKKCEIRIKELEAKTARLRRQKSKLEQKCTAEKM